jgi:hypothetical protein
MISKEEKDLSVLWNREEANYLKRRNLFKYVMNLT